MIALPKLLLLVLVGVAVWYAIRWFNRQPTRVARRRPATSPQPAIEDLVACRICGAYVAADARGCDKPGCPQPR